jgi:hypothetical protein
LDWLDSNERSNQRLADQISDMARTSAIRNAESDARILEMNRVLNSTAGAVTSLHTREERSRILQNHQAQRIFAEQNNTTPPQPLRANPVRYDARTRTMIRYDEAGNKIEEDTTMLEDPEQSPVESTAVPMEEETARQSSPAVAAAAATTRTRQATARSTRPSPLASAVSRTNDEIRDTANTLDEAIRDYRTNRTPIAERLAASTPLRSNTSRPKTAPQTLEIADDSSNDSTQYTDEAVDRIVHNDDETETNSGTANGEDDNTSYGDIDEEHNELGSMDDEEGEEGKGDSAHDNDNEMEEGEEKSKDSHFPANEYYGDKGEDDDGEEGNNDNDVELTDADQE